MANDITALLYNIKQNIKCIEGGFVNEATLDLVRTDYLDMLELAKLFLISERDSYYGYFLMNMQFSADFYSDCIAGIKLNTFPPVFEANPLLLCKFSLKEILYIICHEIDHIVLNHPAEMVKANPTQDAEVFYRFNLASDASVNDRLDYEIQHEHHSFLSHPDGCITSGVLAKMFRLRKVRALESYAYYFNLICGKNSKSEMPQNGAQSMMNEQNQKNSSESSSSGSQGENEADTEQQGEGDTQQIVTAKSCGGNFSDHNWDAGDDEEDITATIREFVNSTVDIMNDETRGLMPSRFMSQVKKLNSPPVLSWQKILKKYIGTITASKRKTRMRLNRRQPQRFDLSGSMDNKVLKIVVAIDTSASVDDNMIAKIFNEIFAILAKRKHEITVIECDAEVQRVYRVKSPSDVKMKVAGRGGTWFTPAIEYINNDRYFRDALLIYFTDGYGESEIPKPKTYRNMWVVVDDARNLSLDEPYGAVLSL